MNGQSRSLVLAPRRTVVSYLEDEGSMDGDTAGADELLSIKQRLARLEQVQTVRNLPVVAARPERQAPVEDEPREGLLRGIMRRMAD